MHRRRSTDDLSRSHLVSIALGTLDIKIMAFFNFTRHKKRSFVFVFIDWSFFVVFFVVLLCLEARQNLLGREILAVVLPAIGDDLELDLALPRAPQLCLDDSVQSTLTLLASLWAVRERLVEAVADQGLRKILLVQAGRAATSPRQDGVNLRPLPPQDVVEVVRGAAEARVLDPVGPEEEHALVLGLLGVGRVAAARTVDTARRSRLCRLVRQEPEVLLIVPSEVRVDREADGLGDLRRPVREHGLAGLVVQSGLGADLRKEAGVLQRAEDHKELWAREAAVDLDGRDHRLYCLLVGGHPSSGLAEVGWLAREQARDALER